MNPLNIKARCKAFFRFEFLSEFPTEVVGIRIEHELFVRHYHTQPVSEALWDGFSSFLIDENKDVPLFTARIKHRASNPFLQVSHRKHRAEFRLRSFNIFSPGGEYTCQTFTVYPETAPHLLNWLRRVPGQVHTPGPHWRRAVTPSEWDPTFHDTIWKARASLTASHLRRYHVQSLREYIRHQRELHGDEHVLSKLRPQPQP